MTAPGVSGPGALSQRTDRSPSQPMRVPTGMPYGDATSMHQAEQAAPMAATTQAANVPPAAVGAPSAPPSSPPALLSDPSQRPHEPVTHGADLGPGGDSSILTAAPGVPSGGAVSQAIAKAAASDPTGVLSQLLLAAQQRGL